MPDFAFELISKAVILFIFNGGMRKLQKTKKGWCHTFALKRQVQLKVLRFKEFEVQVPLAKVNRVAAF